MIVKENIKFGKKDFIKNFSDGGFYIRKVGTDEEYSEAIDLASMGYTYEEILSIREYYRREGLRLREEVRAATQRVKVIESIRKEFESQALVHKYEGKSADITITRDKIESLDKEEDIAAVVIAELLKQIDSNNDHKVTKTEYR